MGISIQNNTCSCYGILAAPYVEGKNCFVRSFGPIPAAMENDTSAKKLAYRVKEFVKGVGLWIPLANIIIYLAMRCLTRQQIPTSNGALPSLGLENFGEHPLLYNICWMNAACQTIFRSPVLVERIELIERLDREKKLKEAERPSELIRLLKGLMDALRKDDKDEVRSIQKQMIKFYKSDIKKNFVFGTQHKPNDFIERVVTDLKLLYSEKQVTQIDQTPPLVENARLPTISMGYRPGDSYHQSIEKRHNLDVMKMWLTTIPPLLVIEIAAPSNATFDKIDHVEDFSSFFTPEIREKHKQLLYKLTSAPQHSDPKVGTHGHYMCQQEENGNHYNDLVVSSIKHLPTVDRNFKDSQFHVWEIVDRTLVDKSYVISG